MGLVICLFFYLSHLLFLLSAEAFNKIGVNYGRLGSDLPSAYQSIEFIKFLKAGRVKIYDANPEILKLLSGTNLKVSIMVQNHEIINIASSQKVADQWIHDNVLSFYPETMIRTILVGNEILSQSSEDYKQIWSHLVPAMSRIKKCLNGHNIHNIKVGTPLAMDIMQTTFPPSNGTFRSDISTSVMEPLLQFLNRTKSLFFLDVYPYFAWSANPKDISLDSALLIETKNYTDTYSGLIYTNLLDQMLDSVIFAMAKLGYSDIRLAISETGWPNAGDVDEIGANIYNAATYNRNLVKKMTATPALGTPARPGSIIPTYIFSLYDENQKTGPAIEMHWGMLHANGVPIYEIDVSGNRSSWSQYKPLPVARNNEPYRGQVWCVVARGVNLMELSNALAYACGQGNGTCDALVPGRWCYEPLSVYWHASYAFSSYWAQFRDQGASCYFNGLAQQTTINPSRGNCRFPSVTL